MMHHSRAEHNTVRTTGVHACMPMHARTGAPVRLCTPQVENRGARYALPQGPQSLRQPLDSDRVDLVRRVKMTHKPMFMCPICTGAPERARGRAS